MLLLELALHTYEDELKKELRTHSLEEASISDKTSPNFNLWDGTDSEGAEGALTNSDFAHGVSRLSRDLPSRI